MLPTPGIMLLGRRHPFRDFRPPQYAPASHRRERHPSWQVDSQRRCKSASVETGARLDSASVRSPRLHAPATRAAAATGQARDDDVEEGDDGVDDGLEACGNGVDNRHDAVADCPEDGLDLCEWLGGRLRGRAVGRGTYAGDYGAHGCGVVVVV